MQKHHFTAVKAKVYLITITPVIMSAAFNLDVLVSHMDSEHNYSPYHMSKFLP